MAKIRKVQPKERGVFSGILNNRSIGDAMAAFYALEHSDTQIELFGAFTSSGTPTAFLVKAQTGMDLFRPLVVPFVAQKDQLGQLLRAALTTARPVLLSLPLEQVPWLEDVVTLSQVEKLRTFRLDPSAFEPIINILIQNTKTPSGWSRYEIRNQDTTMAAAGVNWSGDKYSEIYLDMVDGPQKIGFGKSVLAAISEYLLSEKKIALYRLDEEHVFLKSMLEEVGFRQTAVRTIMAQAVLQNEPD